ncbi:MAG TPA: tape measure protein [Roseiflexaceae bacterium]|nr:tape measure protein [Roseiflexaceae bacterium]
MPLLSQIIARVQADTDPAKRNLREVRAEMVGVGEAAVAASPLIDQLAGRLNGQQQELIQLRRQLDRAVAGYGATSQQAEVLRLAIDGLSRGIQVNGQFLAQAVNQVGIWSQSWSGAQRLLAAPMPTALVATSQGMQALAGITQGAATPVAQLTDRLAFQQRELEQLQNRLTNAVNAHGAASQQAQQLQLAVDRLSASYQTNQQQLSLSLQRSQQAAQAEAQHAQGASQSAQAVQALAQTAQGAEGRVAALAQQTIHQYQQLELLQRGLVTTIARYGEGSQQADRAKLAIDKLTGSIQQNEQRLVEASRRGTDWTQVWIGAQRSVGELAVQAVQRLSGALVSAGQTAVQSYAANERLGDSLEALVAQEKLQSGAAQTMSEALAQSGQQAQALLGWNQQLAVNSPFGEAGVAQAFQMAQSYGFVSDSANKTDITAKRLTQTLIDFAAGAGRNEETMQRIAATLGQIQAKGKLAGDEIVQLSEAGLPIRQILADAMGITTQKVVELQERGLIPANVAIRAVVESLEKNFGGAAARSADSVAGLLNSMEDLQQVSLRNLFSGSIEAMQPLLKELVGTLSDPATQAAITEFGRDFGNGLRIVLPEIVGGIRELAESTQRAYVAAEPLFTFLGDYGVPIVGTLTGAIGALAVNSAAYAVTQQIQTLPAIVATTQALYAQARAAAVAAGPFAAIGLAVGVLAQQYGELQQQADEIAAKLAIERQEYGLVSNVLDRYAASQDYAKQATRAQKDGLEELRGEQQNHIRALAELEAKEQNWAGSNRASAGLRQAHAEAVAREKAEIERLGRAINDQATQLGNSLAGYDELALRSNDAVEDLRLQRDGHSQLQQATEQTTAALGDQTKELAQLASQGAAAFGQLAQSGADWRAEETDQAREHQQRQAELAADAAQRAVELDRDTAEKRAEQAQTYSDKVADIQKGAAASALADQRAFEEQQAAAADTHAQKLSDLAQKGADLQADAARASADAAGEYGRKRAEQVERAEEQLGQIVQRAAEQRAQVEQRYQDQQTQAAQAHEQKLADLAQRAVDLRTEAAREAADQAQRYSDEIADLTQRANEQLGELAQRAADRQQDLERQAQDRQRDQAESHQDKLAELQERLAKAQTDVQREAAQKAIDEENARYERERQRAAEKLQREQQEIQAELARDQQRAAEKLQKELAEAAQERARAEQRAQEKLALKEQELTRQRAQEEAAYAAKTAQEQQRYERSKAEAEAKTAQDLAQQQAAADKSLAALAEQYDREQAARALKLSDAQADLARETADQEREYSKRRQQAQADYARQRAEREAKTAEQLADAQTAYAKEEAETARHYERQRQQQATALADQQAAAQAAYAEQAQQRAVQRAEEEQEQRQQLGRSLIAYAEHLRETGQLDGERAAAFIAQTRAQYEVRETLEQAAYGRATAIIDQYARDAGGSLDSVGRALGAVTDGAVQQQRVFDEQLAASVDQVAQRFAEGRLPIDDYARALRDIPSEIATQIRVDLLASAPEALQRYTDFKDSQGDGGPPKRALGGPAFAGELYEVNEGARREYFRPAVNGTVVPLAPGGGAGGGGMTITGPITIVVQGADASDPRGAALKIRDELIRLGRENGGSIFGGLA